MKKQQGFSLIEIMLALAMGLLLTASFLQLMLGTSQSTYFHEDLATSQENGRHSLYLLSRESRMAGYRSKINQGILVPFYQGGCGSAPTCTFDGGGTANDQVAIQYEPVNGEDCAGNTVPSGELTADVYYVAADPANDNITTLFCRGYDPTTAGPRGVERALVHGVERLQAVYGISGTNTEIVDEYLVASAITDWTQVRSVRYGVLVNSGLAGRAFDLRTRDFDVLDSGSLSFTDRTPRYVYTTAVKLNNTGI